MDGKLTPRIVCELLGHEAIVREWYRDSVNVGTWGVGVTNASGHMVDRYKNNPQSVGRCLEVFLWLLRTAYLPPVLAAFGSHEPTEQQLGAALSFHYNTGKIGKASWLKLALAGETHEAEIAILEWRKPKAIIPRRISERELFFHGTWSNRGYALVYEVAKPSYKPVRPESMYIRDIVEQLVGGA